MQTFSAECRRERLSCSFPADLDKKGLLQANCTLVFYFHIEMIVFVTKFSVEIFEFRKCKAATSSLFVSMNSTMIDRMTSNLFILISCIWSVYNPHNSLISLNTMQLIQGTLLVHSKGFAHIFVDQGLICLEEHLRIVLEEVLNYLRHFIILKLLKI